ncbi:conserved hypothetical protein [Gammaproteobacteria bacterium]
MILFARHPDPLADALQAMGIDLADHCLFDHPEWVLGPRFRLKTCELAYRRPQPDTLLVLRYRRLDVHRGLVNPFADLLWFLELATRSEFAIRHVMGYVSTWLFRQDGGPDDDRLAAFYLRYFRGHTRRYDGHLWLHQEASLLRERVLAIRGPARAAPS